MSPTPERLLPSTYHELLDLLPDEAGMSISRDATVRVIRARDALHDAEEGLREAVWAAFESGNSWLTIGTIVGLSRQAAQQRFGRRWHEVGEETGEGAGGGAHGEPDRGAL